MDELLERLVSKTGVDRTTAEKAVAIILNFLKKEGPADKVLPLLDKLPGAAELLAKHPPAGSGMFSMGGIMGAASQLMSAGLSMGQVQSVTQEVVAYAREKAGDDAIGEVVGAIPGLGQFV